MIKYIASTQSLTFFQAALKIAMGKSAIATKIFGMALKFGLGPLSLILLLVMSVIRNWDYLVDAFTNGGILGALKAIGVVILDAILAPVQYLLELLGKIPGLDIAATGASAIEDFRANLGLDTEGGDTESPVIENSQNQVLKQNQAQNGNLNVNINDPNNRTTVDSRGAPGINVGSTVGF